MLILKIFFRLFPSVMLCHKNFLLKICDLYINFRIPVETLDTKRVTNTL